MIERIDHPFANEEKKRFKSDYFTCKRYVISAKFAVIPGDVRAPVGVTRTL